MYIPWFNEKVKVPKGTEQFVLVDSNQSEKYKIALSALVRPKEPWHTRLLPSSTLSTSKTSSQTKNNATKNKKLTRLCAILTSIPSSFLLLFPSLLFLFPDSAPLQHLAIASIFIDPFLAPYVPIDSGHFLICEHLKLLALVIPHVITVDTLAILTPFPQTEAWKNTILHAAYIPLVFYIAQLVHSFIFFLAMRPIPTRTSIDRSRTHNDLYAQYTSMNNNLLLLLLSPIFLLILMAVKCIKALILFAVGLLLLLLGAAEITCNWTMARFGTYTAEADAEDAGKATKAREATLALDDVQLAPSSPAESKSYLIPGNNKAISDQENLSPRNSEGYMKLSRARSASYEDILASQDTEVSRITLMGDLCSWSKFVVRDFVWPMIVGGPWTVATQTSKWRYSRTIDIAATEGEGDAME